MKLRLDEFEEAELNWILEEIERVGREFDERSSVGKALREAHGSIGEAIEAGRGTTVNDWSTDIDRQSEPSTETDDWE